MNRLPSFLILGAAKAGTTSIAMELMRNSSVFIPKVKELHFFDSDERYSLGVESYQSNFPENSNKLLGEATPSYLSEYEKVIPRVKQTLPFDTKFIVILRDPVYRAWSHYNHMRRSRGEQRDFMELIHMDLERSQRVISWENYFKDGLYARQLENWFEAYSKDQFLVLKFEDLAVDFNTVLVNICNFLGISHEVHPGEKHYNKRSVPRSALVRDIVNNQGVIRSVARTLMPREARQALFRVIKEKNRRAVKPEDYIEMAEKDLIALRQLYLNDVERLEDLTGMSFPTWKQIS